jgi:hypothetical protein
MQVQQELHGNAEVAEKGLHCFAIVAGATILCRNSRRYTAMQKKQALHGNSETAVATPECRISRRYTVTQ